MKTKWTLCGVIVAVFVVILTGWRLRWVFSLLVWPAYWFSRSLVRTMGWFEDGEMSERLEERRLRRHTEQMERMAMRRKPETNGKTDGKD
ncbi:MAG TPA: hypothetical protein VNL17_16345 [Verrucomicrobiae bacterium]|nr:hypothetical protein [Verrucomicrobiae bacterium]